MKLQADFYEFFKILSSVPFFMVIQYDGIFMPSTLRIY